MITVGPTTNTKSARMPASTMLMFDSHWTPLATPETADSDEGHGEHDDDRRPAASLPALVQPARRLEAAADLQGAEAQRRGGTEERREDREDVDDPAVAAVGRLAPISGMNAELIVWRRPLRNVLYAIARPTTA